MSLEKFSSQADPTILVALKDIAKQEGKQFQALVNEAFADLLEKRKQGKARPHVLALLESSMDRYDDVYQHLAQ